MNDHYILRDGKPVECEVGCEEFIKFFNDPDTCRLKLDCIWSVYGEMSVSTVFLGTDHRWVNEGDPILWETMIFGGPYSQAWQERYTSQDDAINGHQRMCREAKLLARIGPWAWKFKEMIKRFVNKR